ncbi:MAG: cytochrome c peroxidase [Pseudomonadota bacterium]
MLGFFIFSLAGAACAHGTKNEIAKIVAPGYQALAYEPPAVGSYSLPHLGTAGDGPLLTEQRKLSTLHQALAGKITVLAFIYTQCDDVNGCPLASFVMGQVARRLAAKPALKNRFQLISYSFDVERDTPQALAKYAESFRPPGVRWQFATAPEASALPATLSAYQQSVQESQGHAFSHILRVFLIDPELSIRNIYSTAFLHADTLANDIETLQLASESFGSESRSAITNPAGAAIEADLGLPKSNVAQASDEEITLGKRLFFDRRLSHNDTISCAMCHIPAQGFTSQELATAVGVEGRTVKRNAPTLLNIGFLETLFHDSREDRLEQQVWSPLLAHNEMANPSVGYVINKIMRDRGYAESFKALYGTGANMQNLGQALAAYQRSLIAGGSRFDRWYFGQDSTALNAQERSGFEIFTGKGRCNACHTVTGGDALFTDQQLHNTGIGYRRSMGRIDGDRSVEIAPGTTIEYNLAAVAEASEPPPNDLGRYEVTEDPADRWKFRTPTLRNIDVTFPYMHDGSLATLDEVVAFYNQGGVPNELLDPLIEPLNLSAQEQQAITAFLRTLTSEHLGEIVQTAQDQPIGNPLGQLH